ncbi:helix-turn-helix domain-containing protein [Vibrio aestuarianus]|uniref:helix-turn-helix transcriptional regulator n=1 Tax=Vibrio aestuarianus TaxID=28171 RepID=UPI00237C5C05|nr:helix-turn-helix transcriptional regulator [Vibrio aestuarianus]MDE1226175.1 helix-turn-helix domain-containing protein [Vibrio aestuarianus]MDE1226180.1 helix-turn-helix domain-containing protein [Vibrio aestuarianus]MDE1329325.1 helix-turn-helix domain-containing protein [Vibrio aestuarianus]MDE1329330.1 helix-turn-helix domain-containing protein [Vibrio aestuarianus]MDH5901721.1 helix-turn-helix domain-containing protein [Vibrio aestuarianus]
MKIMLKDVLKEMRERAGLKQSEVAEQVGVTPQTYMKWENGKNEPKASNLRRLAQILNVTEIELCQGELFYQDSNPIEFMKKVAQYQRLLDEVSFTSILFDHIQDKSKFISHMDIELKKTQGFSVDEIDRMTNDELYGAEEHKKAIDQNSFL